MTVKTKTALHFLSFVWFYSLIVTQGRRYSAVDTILPVNGCPTTREEWMMASMRKNCSAISSTNGTKLEYHCVINEWANATVEVCTANRIILFGKCSEYNHGAKRIQSSGMKICSNFTPSCPTVYNSSEAYMYQGCYNFSTTLNEVSESTNPPRSQDIPPSLKLGIILSSVCFVVAVLFIAGIAVYKRYYKRNIHYDSDESSQSLNGN